MKIVRYVHIVYTHTCTHTRLSRVQYYNDLTRRNLNLFALISLYSCHSEETCNSTDKKAEAQRRQEEHRGDFLARTSAYRVSAQSLPKL